jgi:hypothetical protein
MIDEEKKTRIWWLILCVIATFNLLILAWTLAVVELNGAHRWQLRLCVIYVVVCAFRSFVPRVDLERRCLFDHFFSSMVLGRSAATIAELCFAAQCALFLNEVGHAAGSAVVETISCLVVLPLFIAQLFCWHSVCTLSHWGHAVENSLWTGTFALIGLCLGLCAPRLHGAMAVYAWLGLGLSAAFVAFMVTVDVPMYVKRWRDGKQADTPLLTPVAGFLDALKRRDVTWEWAVWKSEVAWMTAYFSGAVWVSLALAHRPRF